MSPSQIFHSDRRFSVGKFGHSYISRGVKCSRFAHGMGTKQLSSSLLWMIADGTAMEYVTTCITNVTSDLKRNNSMTATTCVFQGYSSRNRRESPHYRFWNLPSYCVWLLYSILLQHPQLSANPSVYDVYFTIFRSHFLMETDCCHLKKIATSEMYTNRIRLESRGLKL